MAEGPAVPLATPEELYARWVLIYDRAMVIAEDQESPERVAALWVAVRAVREMVELWREAETTMSDPQSSGPKAIP